MADSMEFPASDIDSMIESMPGVEREARENWEERGCVEEMVLPTVSWRWKTILPWRAATSRSLFACARRVLNVERWVAGVGVGASAWAAR